MIERLLARTTDRIVAISESQSKELTGKYKIARNDKVVTIPLGFNIDPFLNVEKNDPSSSLSETISTDTVRIGWIGRFTAIKAPELLLDCACLVRDAELPARFFVVGDGELRSTCERRIREQRLEDVVKILGWQRDLPPIYANLDFVVSTSINEGTPVNLLESMASACPFVATNVGGVSDLMVGDGKTIDGMTIFKNGILVPRDAEVLLRAVQYLVERPSLRKSMGLVGREFVKDKFSYSRLADDLEKLYLSIAEEKGYLVCSGDLHSYDRIPINLPCVKAPSVSVDSD
jgi:glycosyltransferase involved in cell wall biosynthesis